MVVTCQRLRGFTLIELLVVISIISLLISVLLPALASARKTAQKAVCMTRQRQAAQVLMQYSIDHFKGDRWLPGRTTFGTGLKYWGYRVMKVGYVNKLTAMQCPTWNKESTHDSDTKLTFGIRDRKDWSSASESVYEVQSPASSFPIGGDSIESASIDANRPQNGRLSNVCKIHLRHMKRANIFYADGHVVTMPAIDLNALKPDDQDYMFHNPEEFY